MQPPEFDTGSLTRGQTVDAGLDAHQPRGPLPVAGLEGLEPRDMAMPRLLLKQAQTKDTDQTGIADVPDGHWFNSLDPAGHSAERSLVFLQIQGQREYYLPYDDPDERFRILDATGNRGKVPDGVQVLCSSTDRVRPTVREWGTLAQACKTCPHSAWTTGASGRRRPPTCSELYRATVLDGDMPAQIKLSGSKVRLTKNLITSLSIAARRAGQPISAFRVSVGSREKRTDRGTYFVPVFGKPEPLPEDEARACLETRAGLGGV